MDLTILYIEDNQIVAAAVKDTLESEGWSVCLCADGFAGLRKLTSDTRYGLILVDNNLPGIQGLELIHSTRRLPHRKNIPIIMLSAGACRREALEAGASIFLRKPEDIPHLVKSINKLFRMREG